MTRPPIEYVEVDGLQLAYQVSGSGPIDLMMVDEYATPLESRWDVPAIANRLDRLGSFARVISFDKRGIGLSDHGPTGENATPELWVRDVVAVADAAGADRPVLFGTHEGGSIALLYAASLPQRTRALVLVNTGPRLTAIEGWPHGVSADDWTPDLVGVTALWRDGTGGEQQIGATAYDPWWRDWYGRTRRLQATPRVGLMLLRMLGDIDVRHIAPSVQVPTQIIHRRDNAFWPVEGARWLADTIPNAEFVELDGFDNYWWAADADPVIDHMERFLLGADAAPTTQRELITIMFTDIVDSTATAARLGDSRWRSVLDRHDDATSNEIRRHGGNPLKNLGDGYLAQFDGPAAAIRAAADLHDTLGRGGIGLRIAIHTGEVERRGDDISGVAVHLASRMLDAAEMGETIVSSVVKGLVAGSPIVFEPRGGHEFKGIPDRWDLFAVVD